MNINRNHHNKTRFIRLLTGLLPSLLMMFMPKNKDRIIFSSDHNIAYKHSSKFLFEYFLEHHQNYDIKFVINDQQKRDKLIKRLGPHFIQTNSFFGMLYALQAKTWIISSLETPVGGVLLNVNRIVHHLSHGSPLKNIGLLEHYQSPLKRLYYFTIRQNFTYFYSSAAIFNEVWAKCLGVSRERVIEQPQARHDLINCPRKQPFKKIIAQVPPGKHVLYAPTWRPFASTKLFFFDDFDYQQLTTFLDNQNINLHIRLHPNFAQQIDSRICRHPRINLLSSHVIHDISLVLGSFDLVITDYSSIYIDFLQTLKPIIFLPYDLQRYKAKVGFAISFSEFTPGPKPNNQADFQKEMQQLLNDKTYYYNNRQRVNAVMNKFHHQHAKTNAEFILNTLN